MKNLSIIIPMYNVAPYIERCIRSLEDQDIPKDEYELICINDGSPDNSGEIVTKLQKEYSNIILINQENQGVSMARNNGIDKASGKYLLCIDPDDYVNPNVLNEKLNILTSNDLDVGLTGFTILSENLKVEYVYDPPDISNRILSGIHYSKLSSGDKPEIRDPHRSVAIFFKTTFIKTHKLYYLPGVPFLEDGEFMYRVLCLAKRVSYIDKPFYLRTTRPGSATHSNLFISDKAISGFINATRNLKEFQEDDSLTSEQRSFLNLPIVKFCLSSVIACTDVRSFYKVFGLRKQLNNNNLKKLELGSCGSWHTKYGRYYNKSIYYFYLMYILLKVKISIKSKFEIGKHTNKGSDK